MKKRILNLLRKVLRYFRTELEQFFDSVEKCTHSEKILSQANDNYGILRERMIADLKSEIKFLRDPVASKDLLS